MVVLVAETAYLTTYIKSIIFKPPSKQNPPSNKTKPNAR